jgi:hypothetical protein
LSEQAAGTAAYWSVKSSRFAVPGCSNLFSPEIRFDVPAERRAFWTSAGDADVWPSR